jgi:hypothetical protein
MPRSLGFDPLRPLRGRSSYSAEFHSLPGGTTDTLGDGPILRDEPSSRASRADDDSKPETSSGRGARQHPELKSSVNAQSD